MEGVATELLYRATLILSLTLWINQENIRL